jgi:fido (protein-threonine AMPylation protein)
VILFELVGHSEAHPAYQELEISNGSRQYDFIRSLVSASLATQRPFLSQHILKALNFHAITCLHTNAGEYRPCPVTVGSYAPPEHFRVEALMEDFVNMVNRFWETSDPINLASFVLWQLNAIHPFINGNGRTARAAAYFVLCVKSGKWLPGKTILPELIRQNRAAYVAALQAGDQTLKNGTLDLSELHALVERLVREQLESANSPPPDQAPPS